MTTDPESGFGQWSDRSSFEPQAIHSSGGEPGRDPDAGSSIIAVPTILIILSPSWNAMTGFPSVPSISRRSSLFNSLPLRHVTMTSGCFF